MSLIMRKLAMYERLNREEETRRKIQGRITEPVTDEIRQNVIYLLELINYSYDI